MRSNEIELFAKVRQWRLCVNSRDDTANTEVRGRPAKERFVIWVEPQNFVTEQTTEIEKITGAAAEIQNVERRRAIKPEVLHAFYVYANPVVRVLVGVDLPRIRSIRVMFTQPYQFVFIYRGENSARTYRVCPAGSMFPQTFRRVTGKEFLNLLRKPHSETMQKTATLLKERRFRLPSLLYVYPNQTGRTLVRHESACPAVARIKELFIPPKHF